MIKARTKTIYDYWLIDITALDSIDDGQLLLNNLNLDLDDDIFIVKFDEVDEKICHIWEIYKINSNQPLIVNNLGTWSENDGFNMTSLQKYERRNDLMVTL